MINQRGANSGQEESCTYEIYRAAAGVREAQYCSVRLEGISSPVDEAFSW